MILIVTYDLKGPAGTYEQFFETLKAQGRWWHYLRPTWLISTDKAPQAVFDALRPHIQPPDRFFVVQMGPRYQGWLPKEAWEWIHKYEKQ